MVSINANRKTFLNNLILHKFHISIVIISERIFRKGGIYFLAGNLKGAVKGINRGGAERDDRKYLMSKWSDVFDAKKHCSRAVHTRQCGM